MTPLIKISDKIYAKLEAYQPTGSVKDRMVNYIVDHAVRNTQIMPGFTRMIEATSGNTGISLAARAARMHCPCVIVMPCNMSEQRKDMMRAFGAQIVEVGPNDFAAAIETRNKLLAKFNRPAESWCPFQFENKLNIQCHYETTAVEILDQAADLELEISAFVHGAGTGGTMMGVKKHFIDHDLDIPCVLTMPAESASTHGIQGINDGADFLLDKSLMTNFIRVETSEAIDRMKKFARESGLLVGISSGANICAAEAYAETFDPSGIVITILCDRGERYL